MMSYEAVCLLQTAQSRVLALEGQVASLCNASDSVASARVRCCACYRVSSCLCSCVVTLLLQMLQTELAKLRIKKLKATLAAQQSAIDEGMKEPVN